MACCLLLVAKRRRTNAMAQEQATLACTECQRRNYHTSKNKKNVVDRLELSKYCKWCHKHTPHRETK